MARRFRNFGLVLAVACALAALAAPGASAEGTQGMITAAGPVTLDMTELAGKVNAFTTFGNKVKCPGTVYTGHKFNVTPHELIENKATAITVTPDFGNCTVEGGGKVTITMNECDFVINIGLTVAKNRWATSAHVACPAGKAIVEDFYFSSTNENLKVCEVTTGEQTVSGPVEETIETEGGLADIEFTGTFGGMKSKKTGTCGTEETAVGEWHFNVTAKGTNKTGGATAVTLSD